MSIHTASFKPINDQPSENPSQNVQLYRCKYKDTGSTTKRSRYNVDKTGNKGSIIKVPKKYFGKMNTGMVLTSHELHTGAISRAQVFQ